MKKARTIALLLAVAMMVSLFTGCGPKDQQGSTGPSDETPVDVALGGEVEKPTDELTDPQEIIIGCQNDVGSMRAGGTTTSGKRMLTQGIYEGLFTEGFDGEWVPRIGKSMEYLGNGTYQFELFDYVYDSAGNPLTASDVVFSWELQFADGLDDYSFVKDLHAASTYVVEVTFEPLELASLNALLELSVFTQKSYEDSPDGMASYPVGTGGYTLVDSTIGSTYTVEKRDDYWQTDPDYITEFNTYNLDKITIKIITDTNALAIALQRGEIDYSPDIAAADYVNFMDKGQALDGYGLCVGVDLAFCRLVFNCGENSQCQDENLRKAIAYAIDADACRYNVHGDLGYTLKNAYNPGFMDADESLDLDDYYNYNVEKAKELLADSSYDGSTIRILVQPNKNITPSATLIQQYLAEIGVKAELLQYEFAQYAPLKWDEEGTGWDIHLEGVSSSDKYAYQGLEELGMTHADGSNYCYVKDEKLAQLFAAVADPETSSVEATKALLDEAYEHCYIYALYYGVRVAVGRDYVKSVFASPNSGSPVFTCAYIQK